MQPYFCPYLGYFQLMNSVDRFVLFDDVNYIKKGWINRNRILVNGSEYLFTIPLEDVSQNKLICETMIVQDNAWKSDLIKTMERAYRKALQFDSVFPLIQKILLSEERIISRFIANSLFIITAYLGMATFIVPSSAGYANRHLKGQDRILDICARENATEYHNAVGGTGLYSQAAFTDRNIALRFVRPRPYKYAQFSDTFIPELSIIDVLMFNPVENIRKMLSDIEMQ